MKKNELKKILKPLIKQCIKEVIFEDGTLSTIIAEVLRGTSSSQPIVEVKNVENNEKRLLARQEKSKAKRRKMLDAIGRDAYNGVDLFEGTTPAPAQGTTGKGALSDVNPNDPGVDISSIFSPESSQIWKKLSGK